MPTGSSPYVTRAVAVGQYSSKMFAGILLDQVAFLMSASSFLFFPTFGRRNRLRTGTCMRPYVLLMVWKVMLYKNVLDGEEEQDYGYGYVIRLEWISRTHFLQHIQG